MSNSELIVPLGSFQRGKLAELCPFSDTIENDFQVPADHISIRRKMTRFLFLYSALVPFEALLFLDCLKFINFSPFGQLIARFSTPSYSGNLSKPSRWRKTR
jgi:hypothetical protein